MENESNDGDSFHVKHNGKEFIFRLYFVDTCEDSQQIPERVKEQAKALGITTDRVIEAGKAAQAFTHGLLAGKPFTVVTKWEDARGASRLPRNYAFVLFGDNDANDLASTLAQNGFVRIYGMPADPPGPITEKEFRSNLLKLDAQARAQHLGVFGNLAGGGSTAGSGITGESASNTSGGSKKLVNSAPIFLPANVHSPDVVDNPTDDLISDYTVDSANAHMIIQSGIPEGDYSEVPGWKPPVKKKKAKAADSSTETTPDEVPD